MSSVITTSPTLNYVSSADISSTSNANSNLTYQLLFHESVVTYGNIIMFEYMIQPKDDILFSPDNTTYGFLSVEVASTTGILNQYVLSVPASEQTYDGQSTKTIQFRVYTGDKETNTVIVTEWSNALNVCNPPHEPNFSSAFAYYDENVSVNNNDLFVFFDSNTNPYDYGLPEDSNTGMKFIVCYYYKKSSDGTTIWGVSDPVRAEPLAGHPSYKVLKVNDIERVLENEDIYISVHAEYNWQYNNNNYYSVSSASTDLTARPAITDSYPDINAVSYQVYEANQQQEILVGWEAPKNIIIDNFKVSKYQLYVSINSNPVFVAYGDELGANTTSLLVDVSNLDCGDTIKFLVEVTTELGQVTRSAQSSLVNIFKYAGPVSDLVVNNTNVNSDKTVELTVNFQSVSYTGCGIADDYDIKINGNNSHIPTSISLNNVPMLVPSLLHVDNAHYSVSYTIPAENDVAVQVGSVDVCLKTMDNNSSDLQNGQSLSAPYVANNLVLQPIDYEVYNNGQNQIMNLSWNDLDIESWHASNYLVEVKIGSGDWSGVAGVDDEIQILYPYTNKSYQYNVSLSSVSENVLFRVIATLVNDDVSYNIMSNQESKDTFSYAGPVSNLVVNNTSVEDDNTVKLTVVFNGSANTGLGAPESYVVVINDEIYTPDSGSLEYVLDKVYSISYSLPPVNGLPVKTGNVDVYLQTTNTNSPFESMNGEILTTYYVANNLVLQPVDYLVYNNKEQIMDLTWNDLSVGPWSVTNYKVEVKIGTENWAPVAGNNLLSPYLDTSYSHQVDLTKSSDTQNISFRVTATLVKDGSLSYINTSNLESKYTFLHAEAVSGLVVDNTSVGVNNEVYLKVNFNGIAITGLGAPSYYVITINDQIYNPTSGSLAYDSINPTKLYSINYILPVVNSTPFPNVGSVKVLLQTSNTNSPFELMDGEPSIAPYIATNLILNDLVYDVYANNTQNVQLSWNYIDLQPWSVSSYAVYVKQGSGEWGQVTTTENNLYTYSVDLSDTNSLSFKVVATVANGAVNYDIASNEKSVMPFSYSNPVSNTSVNWSVSDKDNTIMDVYVSFYTPLNSGVNGGIYKYVVSLYDENDELLESKDITPSQNVEHVYFNDVSYTTHGDVKIDVFVNDNNNNDTITLYNTSRYTIAYVTSSVPVFINVSFDQVTSQLSGTIVTNDVLKKAGRLIYIDNNSLKEVQINTSGNLINGFDISNPIPNPNQDGTLSYNFVLDYNSFSGLSSANDCSVSVSNNFGIGTLINYRI